jgi:hypothetical protein
VHKKELPFLRAIGRMGAAMSDAEDGSPPPAPTGDTSDGSRERLLLRRIELSAGPIGRMINIISLIAGAISLIVVLSVVAIAIIGQPIPEVLSNWGGIILGFYFGQFITLVKDYMGVLQTASAAPRD